MMLPRPQALRQRGLAVVSAMLLLAAMVAAVVPHAADERVAVARTARVGDLAQARLAARGAERWVGTLLLDDGRQTRLDHPGEAWARPVNGLAVEGGTLSGQVVDEQGRFNVNGLLVDGVPDPLAVQRFERLLANLDLPVTLAAAVLDWLDADDVPRLPGGAESETYLAREPALAVPARRW